MSAASGHRPRIARYHVVDLCQQFSVKFVLEVLGGAGAVWGSSEAMGLRTSHTAWFFRPLALAVFTVFLIRWLVQIRRALRLLSRGDRIPPLADYNDDLVLCEEQQEVEGYGMGANIGKDDLVFTTEIDYDTP